MIRTATFDQFFDTAWVVWIILTFLTFAALEAYAFIKHGKGFTLSEHVWKWFRIKDANARDNNMVNDQPVTWVLRGRRLLLLNIFLWPLLHFFTGGQF